MSVTVADLLRLSSLRNARVEAGRGGLSRIVASLSVLEYADPDQMVDAFFRNDDYYGSEIVITGFMNNPEDEERQCAVTQRLAEAGEGGLILYYVGLFMPRIPEAMKRIADAYHFVLIVMPENRMDFRYSDAISEIMEAIVKDRLNNTAFVGELLDQVARLPEHQRSVGTMLKMLSERIMASILLTDQSFRVLNEAVWPLNQEKTLSRFLTEGKLPEMGSERTVCIADSEYVLARFPILLHKDRHMELFIFKEGEPLVETVRQQVVEAVQLAVNIWSTQHDEVDVTELVRAILKDEPMKMRRLADIFHIDVASIHSMMIFHVEEDWQKMNGVSALKGLTGLLSSFYKTVFADICEGEMVIFVEGPRSLGEEKEILTAVQAYMEPYTVFHTITCCNHLADTAAVREAFLLHRDYIEDTIAIFPEKEAYHLQEIGFARDCRERIGRGEEAVQEALRPLAALRDAKEEKDAVRTLEVYLLDAQCSYLKTGELLYLHKNTVKYRIQRFSDILGYRIGDFPDTFSLYCAVAVNRLLTFCPK